MPLTLNHKRFELIVILTHEEEIREVQDRRRRRRKDWVVKERRLVEVLSTRTFRSFRDLLRLFEANLPPTFTTLELAHAMEMRRAIAQKAAYCLRQARVIEVIAKSGNALVYQACQS